MTKLEYTHDGCAYGHVLKPNGLELRSDGYAWFIEPQCDKGNYYVEDGKVYFFFGDEPLLVTTIFEVGSGLKGFEYSPMFAAKLRQLRTAVPADHPSWGYNGVESGFTVNYDTGTKRGKLLITPTTNLDWEKIRQGIGKLKL